MGYYRELEVLDVVEIEERLVVVLHLEVKHSQIVVNL